MLNFINKFKIPVVPWNKLYRKSIIIDNDITFPEGKLYEDNAFYWKYIAFCNNVYFINKKLHYYNVRTLSLRGEVIHKKVEKEQDRIYMIENVFNFYKTHNFLDKNIELLSKLFINSFLDAYKETQNKDNIIKLSKELA